jgi:zinc finger protein
MSSSSVFSPLNPDEDIEKLNRLPSVCVNCQEEGETRLLLSRIPYFREVVIMSFQCDHCGLSSSEVQPAAEISEKASRFILTIHISSAHQDLNRQVIKSGTATVKIPDLEFEIPPSGRGEINTIEGFLSNIADSLTVQQANRYLSDESLANKIQAIINQIREMASGERGFTFILDDLAGNSFVENPLAPSPDPRVICEYYERSKEQTEAMGYEIDESAKNDQRRKELEETVKFNQNETGQFGLTDERINGVKVSDRLNSKVDTYFNVSDRSACIPGACPSCQLECETRLCVTDIPHFKDVVILVTDCSACGYRDTEVKPMGRVSENGLQVKLAVKSVDDLKRDLLKVMKNSRRFSLHCIL